MLRSFRHARGLTVAVILMVALGTGTLTAAFGVARATLWRDPPFVDPGTLVMLTTTHTAPGGRTSTMRWSFPLLADLRSRVRTLDRVATFTPSSVRLTGTDDTRQVMGEVVSAEYFPALAVAPARGRTFTVAEDRAPGGTPVVVLAHELWRQRFGGREDIAGHTIGINGETLTIIGVMPPGYRGLSGTSQLWIPTSMAPRLTYDGYLTTDQLFISAVARMRPGVTLAGVRSELALLGTQAFAARPRTDVDSGSTSSATALTVAEARVVPGQRVAVLLLLGAIALLHLLASVNVTSLLLSEALGRRREFAVRAALGGTTTALVRHAFARGAILAGTGGVLGLWLAWALSRVSLPLEAWALRNPNGNIAAFAEPAFDAGVLAMGLVVALVTLVVVALPPALLAIRGDLAEGLRTGTHGSARAGLTWGRAGARGVILMAESALAATLLVVGVLMVESFERMRRTPVGVEGAPVLTFTLQPSEIRVPPSQAPAFIDRVLAELTAVPGVVSASVDGGAPLSGSASAGLRIVGEPAPSADAEPIVTRHYVAPAHFTTLGIPVVRGRTFTDADREGSPRVVVISESAARRFWPGRDPIGGRVWFSGGSSFDAPERSAEVVGIVGDVLYRPLDRPPVRESFYTPYRQFTYAWRTWFVKASGDPSALVPALRAAVHRVDPDLPLAEVRTMGELFGASWARQRTQAGLFGVFALVALLLAVSGTWAVVSHATQQRSREMAIRLAVGASPFAVLRLVVREGMTFPVAGLVLGLLGARALAGVLRLAVHGIAPDDPAVLASVVTLLTVTSIVACAIPGLRAMRTMPQDALRAD